MIHPVARASMCKSAKNLGTAVSRAASLSSLALLGAIAGLTAGCQNSYPEAPPADAQSVKRAIEEARRSDALVLREGDVVKVSVPGASNLESVQPIRRDGRITLALIGEVQAAGLTSAELQAQLLKLYAPQLVSKEVNVTIVSSSFAAFVSGAVLHPGKITSDRPITVLEAIMEAGGFDYSKANLKSVVVIRQNSEGKTQNFNLNLKLVLEGKHNDPFYLKPSDIIYVPERFALY